jgi:hypothetical protein
MVYRTTNIAEALKNLDFDLDSKLQASETRTPGADKTDTVDSVLASTIHNEIFDPDL